MEKCDWIADIIYWFHLLFIAWIVLSPFLGRQTRYLVIIVIPFLFFHWFINDDTCALTVAECYVRGVPKTGSFVHQVVGPVYDRAFINSLSTMFLASLWTYHISMETPKTVFHTFRNLLPGN